LAEKQLSWQRAIAMIAIRENPQGVTFTIRVHPRGKENAVIGELGNALKVSLTTPPVEGRANQACIEFFAKLLRVPQSSITIASGLRTRNKVIRVVGVTGEYVRERLAGTSRQNAEV
jgi:uncharacterized protein